VKDFYPGNIRLYDIDFKLGILGKNGAITGSFLPGHLSKARGLSNRSQILISVFTSEDIRGDDESLAFIQHCLRGRRPPDLFLNLQKTHIAIFAF
jgi:hypothetical protein